MFQTLFASVPEQSAFVKRFSASREFSPPVENLRFSARIKNPLDFLSCVRQDSPSSRQHPVAFFRAGV
jgi:hypothetical protein